MNRGKLLVISAPSGAGKTTLCHRILTNHPDFKFSVSATTRPMRANETDGKDYIFLSADQFSQKVQDGEFVEWEWVHENQYGTLSSTLADALDQGQVVVLDVDVKGGVNIKRQFPNDTMAIFINAQDVDTLRRRLEHRATDSPESIARRVRRIPEELAYRSEYDRVIMNENLEQALMEIESIVKEIV